MALLPETAATATHALTSQHRFGEDVIPAVKVETMSPPEAVAVQTCRRIRLFEITPVRSESLIPAPLLREPHLSFLVRNANAEPVSIRIKRHEGAANNVGHGLLLAWVPVFSSTRS
jgi:hypothetical protein